MRSKLLIFVATGFTGLMVGAGIGVVSAAPSSGPMTAEQTAQCGEMHASMPGGMASMDPASMDPASMGSMMSGGTGGGMSRGMSGGHAQHH